MLCDISGSMEPYSRAYLQFLACAAGAGPNAEAFVFATRLTRVTRALASRHPDRAIQRAAAAAPGLVERDSDRRRAEAVQRSPRAARDGPRSGGRDPLRRLGAGRSGRRRRARWSAWRGSRTGSSGSTRGSRAGEFSVRAGGMVAALEHCDALVSGHSYAALAEVVEAIGAARLRSARRPRRRSLEPPETGGEPGRAPRRCPGSSVAMPSGYGPSRGRTTPGWSVGERD